MQAAALGPASRPAGLLPAATHSHAHPTPHTHPSPAPTPTPAGVKPLVMRYQQDSHPAVQGGVTRAVSDPMLGLNFAQLVPGGGPTHPLAGPGLGPGTASPSPPEDSSDDGLQPVPNLSNRCERSHSHTALEPEDPLPFPPPAPLPVLPVHFPVPPPATSCLRPPPRPACPLPRVPSSSE